MVAAVLISFWVKHLIEKWVARRRRAKAIQAINELTGGNPRIHPMELIGRLLSGGKTECDCPVCKPPEPCGEFKAGLWQECPSKGCRGFIFLNKGERTGRCPKCETVKRFEDDEISPDYLSPAVQFICPKCDKVNTHLAETRTEQGPIPGMAIVATRLTKDQFRCKYCGEQYVPFERVVDKKTGESVDGRPVHQIYQGLEDKTLEARGYLGRVPS